MVYKICRSPLMLFALCSFLALQSGASVCAPRTYELTTAATLTQFYENNGKRSLRGLGGETVTVWTDPEDITGDREIRRRRMLLGMTQQVVYEVPLPTLILGSALIGTGTWRSLNFSEPCSDNEPEIFNEVIVTPDDEGLVVFTDSSTDPGFAEVVSFLSNGVDDPMTLRGGIAPNTGGAGLTEMESIYFAELPGGNGVDLEGIEIAALGFRYDHIEINIPGADPNGNGIWTDVVLDVTLLVIESDRFFGDDFESGDTLSWSHTEP